MFNPKCAISPNRIHAHFTVTWADQHIFPHINRTLCCLYFPGKEFIIRSKFLLLIEEGYLTVYYSDRHDVYLETYVTEDELPAAEVPALKRGYYVKSEAELYDYLQSVTS